MKKICFVLTAEFAVKAFMLKHIKTLSKYFEVTVIVNTQNPYLLKELGLNAKLIPMNIAREISPIVDFICLLKLSLIFLTKRYDAVHSITPKAGLLAMLAALITLTRHRIHTFQGEVWVTKQGLLRWLLISLDKLVAKIATQIIVVSQSERDFLISHNIINNEKSIVFNQGSIAGVDLTRFRQDSVQRKNLRTKLGLQNDDVVYLFIGRINRDKGILDLVEAFSLVNNPKCHLMIVGPDEHGLNQTIKSTLKTKKSSLHIFPETDRPEDYMVAGDVLCLPSYREGFGVVIIEAAAVGIPAIASRIYGITDAIVDKETGLLHEPQNINEIKDQIESLASDTKLRVKLGSQARDRVIKDFNSGLIAQAWVNFYQEKLEEV